MRHQGSNAGEQAKLVRASVPVRKASLPAAGGAIFSDVTGMDWVSINSGRGVRVNIYATIDKTLRKDWSRLIKELTEKGVSEVEINLMDAHNLSLAGLGMLLLLKERKPKTLSTITLCNCNRDLKELLEWTGLDKHFDIDTTKISNS